MSGNKARKLRKIATRDFKAHGGKYGIFWSDSTKRTLINAYRNYYRHIKALYTQGTLKLI